MTAGALAARALAPYLAELARRVRDIDEVEADIIRSAARICIETVDGELFPSDVVRMAGKALDRASDDRCRWVMAVTSWPPTPKRCTIGFDKAMETLRYAHDAEWRSLSENSWRDDDVMPYKHRAAAIAGWMTLVENLSCHDAEWTE